MGYRYIGSKEKLADTIIQEIQLSCPDAHSIIDLMAGTGLFSKSLRGHGYLVIASDMMMYSYHHLIVQLLLNRAPEFANFNGDTSESRYMDCLNILNNLPVSKGFFYEEFSPDGTPSQIQHPRKYFTSENAGKIDSIRNRIKQWYQEGYISDTEHSLLIHDLIMATNDVANIAGTYGHYLSHFVQRALVPINLIPTDFYQNDNTQGHVVLCGKAEDLAQNLTGDVCYIDPPYIKRQYAANYHILETIAQEDTPEAIGESGLRNWWNKHSAFCTKTQIRDSFRRVFNDINCNQFFISYSEDGLLSLKEMTDFLSNFGNLSIKEIPYKRFKSNDSKKGEQIIEYLFHLTIL